MNRPLSQSPVFKPGWATIVLVTLVAFFTHMYRLGNLWPVPYFDPAYNGLDALRVIHRGVTPIFFATNGGREPLFLYMQTLAIWGLGVNSFALRLPGAMAGALTVPLLFGFTRTILAKKGGPLPTWVSAWASMGLALSIWSVSQTREGVRAAILPLVSVSTLWFFVVGWRRASLPHLVAAGALLGLSAYTYTAARFLPFVLTLAALPDLLAKPSARSAPRLKRWMGFGILTLAAIIVFAPLASFYLRYPAMFDERASSVMIWNVWQPGSGSTLIEELVLSLWRTLLWFIRFPIPLSFCLVVGLGLTLTRLRRFEYRLLAVWWLIMLMPAVLTIETPHPMRSFGAAPPTYILVALGVAAIASWLIRRWPISSYLILVSGLLIITLSSLPALWNYFHPAIPDPESKTQALADSLLARSRTGVVYLPLSAYADPSLRFMLAGEFERRADWTTDPSPTSTWLIQPVQSPASPAVVRLSPDGWITLLPPLTSDGQRKLQKSAPGDGPITDRYGTIVGYETVLPALADPAHYLMPIDFSANTDVKGIAALVGYTLEGPETGSLFPYIAPGSPFWVTTFWQAHGSASQDHDLVVRLIDDNGRQWAQTDGPPLAGTYPTSMWQPGEKVADGRLLWVDPNAPPGRYWLAVAFYDYLTDSRLPVSGSSIPDTILLGPLKIPLPSLSAVPDGVQPQSAHFGNVAQLLGYQLTKEPKAVTLITLHWKAETPDDVDYTVFVHLLDEEGQLALGQDNQPVSGGYPTGIWEPGELILDEYTLDTSELAPGEYQLEVGMYVPATGERLPVHTSNGIEEPTRQLTLTTSIEVR